MVKFKHMVLVFAMLVLSGCAVLSPEYKEQNQALKDYHAAEVKLGVTKAHLSKVEGQLEKAKLSVGEAQLQRDSAKAALDKLVIGK